MIRGVVLAPEASIESLAVGVVVLAPLSLLASSLAALACTFPGFPVVSVELPRLQLVSLPPFFLPPIFAGYASQTLHPPASASTTLLFLALPTFHAYPPCQRSAKKGKELSSCVCLDPGHGPCHVYHGHGLVDEESESGNDGASKRRNFSCLEGKIRNTIRNAFTRLSR